MCSGCMEKVRNFFVCICSIRDVCRTLCERTLPEIPTRHSEIQVWRQDLGVISENGMFGVMYVDDIITDQSSQGQKL